MKLKPTFPLIQRAALLSLLSTIATFYVAQLSTAFAQGTAFTYQGRLNDNGSPANGSYDFRFRLSSDALGNNYVGSTVLTNGVSVGNGLFIVTLDFGASYPGADRWLELGVRTNGSGGYATLLPLQALTPTPYAVFAVSASNLSGVIPSGGLSGSYSSAVSLNNAGNTFRGTFTGNGGGLTNVNAATLEGINAGQLWNTSGNSNTVAGVDFLGTADNQPVEIKVNNQRALRFEYSTNTPNIIGGWSNNFAAPGVVMATIGGGGGVSITFGTFNTNSVWSSYGTVGGGAGNQAGSTNGDPSLVRGATVGGGGNNTAGALYSTIAGGAQNTISLSNDFSFIGGGYLNNNSGYAATLGGGLQNTNTGSISFIGGGRLNFIGNQADSSTIGGGSHNQIVGSELSGVSSTIGGGFNNNIYTNGTFCTIGGGQQNNIQADAYGGTIGGGLDGFLAGKYATIPGGFVNTATGFTSFAAGRRARANHDGAFVWADSLDADFDSTATNQFNVRANGGVRFVTGGAGMTLDGQAILTSSTLNNVALRTGGNAFTGQQTITGGSVGIGTASPVKLLQVGDSAVASSEGMIHLGSRSPSGASLRDWELGVPQTGDTVTGEGYSFVIRDTTVGLGSGTRLFIKWGTGNVGIGTSTPVSALQVVGTVTATAFNPPSDRNLKENFTPISPREVLDKVAAMPISRWNFIGDVATPHVGPMAQDFHAAFGLGTDDKHIATVDADGVALAAIQGLNQKVEEERAELKQKQTEIAELKHELEMLKQVVGKLTDAKD